MRISRHQPAWRMHGKANIRETPSPAETGPYRCRIYSITPPPKQHYIEAYTLVLDTTDSPFEKDDDVPAAPMVAKLAAETADDLVSQVTAVGRKYPIAKSSIWGTPKVDNCIDALIGTLHVAIH